MNFKVGDRVQVEDAGRCYPCYETFIRKYAPEFLQKWAEGRIVRAGTLGRVVARAKHESNSHRDGFLCIILTDSGNVYVVGEKGLSLVSNRVVVITTDGKTTTARLKDGKKTVNEKTAVCNPSDTFSFNTGASLALNRLLYGTDYNPGEVTMTQEEPKEGKPAPIKLYGVKDYKPGEWYTKGKVYAVTHGNGSWRFLFKADNGYIVHYNRLDEEQYLGHALSCYLVPLVRRHAKVGEWVYVTSAGGHGVPVSTIHKVYAFCRGWPIVDGTECYRHTIRHDQYLVLDGYDGRYEGPEKPASKEMTVAEIEEKLGYPVKVIKGEA